MKRILVTGASDGLGAKFGAICAGKGIEVVCLSRSAPAYNAKHVPVDLTSQQSMDAAIETVKSDYPDFDALVHCAGVISIEPAADISYENISRTLAVNLMTPIYLNAGLFDLIRQNGADVVHVGSTVGTKAYVEQCAYGASKWGVRGVSQNLALELKGTPCRVIQFNPGGFKSDFVQKFTGKPADLSAYMNPEDLAKLLYFILELPKSVEVSEILINRK